MENLPQTISQVIDTLSQKFGSTGRALWESIVRQQIISSSYELFISIVLVIAGIIIFPGWYRKIEDLTIGTDDCWVAWIPFVIILSFVIIFIIVSVYDFITAISNPQYAALKDILGKISSK